MNARPVVLCRKRNGAEVRLFGLYVGRWQAGMVWAVSRAEAIRRGRSRRFTPQIPDEWRPRLRAKLERRRSGHAS